MKFLFILKCLNNSKEQVFYSILHLTLLVTEQDNYLVPFEQEVARYKSAPPREPLQTTFRNKFKSKRGNKMGETFNSFVT